MRNRTQFFREWRKHRGYSQERVANELEDLAQRPEFQDPSYQNMGRDRSLISKIENGKVPYTQMLLEMLAEIYNTDPGSLIMRNPLDTEAVYSIWDRIPADRKKEALRLLMVFAEDETKSTGTNG